MYSNVVWSTKSQKRRSVFNHTQLKPANLDTGEAATAKVDK